MSAQLRVVRPAVLPLAAKPSPLSATSPDSPATCLATALADWAPEQAVTLGCVPAPDATSAQVLEAAMRAIDALALHRASATLSVDPSAFGHVATSLARVLAQAQHMGVRVQFDWLAGVTDPEAMSLTREALMALHVADLPLPAVTLVARWLRSRDDAEWACAQALPVRIVKGHQADPRRPLHDANAGFLSLVQRVAGRARRVTLATNDPSLAQEGLARLLRAGTTCELELMHGPARSPALQVARRLGVPVRCYVPWGVARRPLSVSPSARDPREAGWAREAPRALRLLSRL